MHYCTQYIRPCSRPPPTHASAGDSWTLMGMSGSVSCGVTAPFSRVLVCTSFCLRPPRVCFPVLCSSGSSMVGLMVTSSERAYAIARPAAPRAPATGHCQPTSLLETPGHSQAGLGQSLVGSLLLSPGSWCTQASVCAHQQFVSQSCVRSGYY